MNWNTKRKRPEPNPDRFLVAQDGDEYLALCARARAGEFVIEALEVDLRVNRKWMYRLEVYRKPVPKPVQESLL